MKKSKFTEAQIVFALRQSETGVTVAEVCRKMGISEATYYNWKRKYGGLGTSELRRLRELEAENQQLKRLVADLLARQAYGRAAGGDPKKALKPAKRRELARYLMDHFRVSARRASAVVLLSRSTLRYQPSPRSTRRSRPASGRSPRRGFGTATGASTCSSAGRAGR